MSLKRLSVLIPIVMLPLGLWLGYRAFYAYSWSEIAASVTLIPTSNLALAVIYVAGSYLCLTGFDTLAVRYLGRSLQYRKISLTSFISLSISHTIGLSPLSSGALRYRFYSGFGLSGVDVGKIIVFCAVTVGLGLMSLGGLVLFLKPDPSLSLLGLTPAAARDVGLLCLGLVSAYVVLAWSLRRPLSLRGHEFCLPTAGIAVAQIIVGTANFAFVAAALQALLTGAATYPETIGAYVLGNAAGLLTHIPAGLGVFEFVITSLVAHGNVVGALIAFRIVYFLVPLVLGSTLLVAAELVRWRAG